MIGHRFGSMIDHRTELAFTVCFCGATFTNCIAHFIDPYANTLLYPVTNVSRGKLASR
jgi:hypothetical protein